MRPTWLRRTWTIVTAIFFLASIALPIAGYLDGSLFGIVGGIYLGLIAAAVWLTLMVIAIFVRGWQRARQTPPAELPAARVAKR